ncbi:uncharacterized protein LOC120069769 isoform X3 [Benincasa hispida]|uniref:uncharacterized protein LOC120069769 isoform X3 n=1 Tax=Benincasa hispida TaxID=102211 RepID=UPI0019018986|nr:uncharacterized protein LOC120069769 isoform X3 [Benincasa hispida]
MPWGATMIGALLGLGTQMCSNALRKLPHMRHPWGHLVGMGLGAVFFNELVKRDARHYEALDKMFETVEAATERGYYVSEIKLQNRFFGTPTVCVTLTPMPSNDRNGREGDR